MSDTVRGEKAAGTDWWSRRPFSGLSASSRKPGTMKAWKRLVHKAERRQGQRASEDERNG